jgi:hypothetical protein
MEKYTYVQIIYTWISHYGSRQMLRGSTCLSVIPDDGHFVVKSCTVLIPNTKNVYFGNVEM